MVSKQLTPSNSGANRGLIRSSGCFLTPEEDEDEDEDEFSWHSLVFRVSVEEECLGVLVAVKGCFRPNDSAQKASMKLNIDINIWSSY
ncbi:hypothetical protein HanIR_Chr08g0367421 [Helianthus annuus]|nr:hypothetical protein HanIR_Chr08g0367421 [Helianthus annuus]